MLVCSQNLNFTVLPKFLEDLLKILQYFIGIYTVDSCHKHQNINFQQNYCHIAINRVVQNKIKCILKKIYLNLNTCISKCC